MKVYTLDGESVEMNRDSVIVTDRSRINEGKKCPRKRWIKYEAMGTGLESKWRSEDLELGSAVHEGLDRVMTGTETEFAASGARLRLEKMVELEIENDNGAMWSALPEVAQLLRGEQAALTYALVWIFGKRLAGRLLEEYEILSTEEEINWLLGDGEKSIVMMSRPDGVWRRRSDGQLFVVSYKTAKKFEPWTLENLECDSQGLTEGLAAWARYGEKPAGILYFYLLKGTKYQDKELGVKRYTSSLVRPWMNEQVGMGDLLPSQFAMEYEFYEPSEGKTRRLGKGWKRVDIWTMMDLGEWLRWLDEGLVQPELGRDWLGEVIAEPQVRMFDEEQADRWIKGAAKSEQIQAANNFIVAHQPTKAALDTFIPLSDQACFQFGRRCFAFDTCFRGVTIEQKVVNGDWIARTPNHGQEGQT